MKIEDQVCSLELSKRLKELDVEQDSLFVWTSHGVLYNEKIPAIVRIDCSAFTVAEIGKMLPGIVEIKNRLFYISMDYCKYPYYRDMPLTEEIFSGMDNSNDSEADARAKMLIYLIENELIKL